MTEKRWTIKQMTIPGMPGLRQTGVPNEKPSKDYVGPDGKKHGNGWQKRHPGEKKEKPQVVKSPAIKSWTDDY